MQDNGGKLHRQTPIKTSLSKRAFGSKLATSFQNRKGSKVSPVNRYKPKPRSHVKTIASVLTKRKTPELPSGGARNNLTNGKPIRRKSLKKTLTDTNTSKKELSSALQRVGKLSAHSCVGHGKNDDKDGETQKIERRRRKKRRKNREVDEESRLRRRTRYLLIKMKLEQNLIDAYSAEGWQGKSREKIKPEKELQRAKNEILKCKLGIRDAIHQLETLSSEGRLEDSVVGPDGSVFHEHIFCSKCKQGDVLPENDIILCDGTCNCAFHQKCLEPPLATENIPPEDQGWLCKFCICKTEILEVTNAHLGTQFSANSKWQDIFQEAAMASNPENESRNPGDEWPSDDSEDDDYDPDSRIGSEENISDGDGDGDGDDDDDDDGASSYSSLLWTSEEESGSKRLPTDDCLKEGLGRSKSDDLDENNILDSTDSLDSADRSSKRRRQRRDVDYKKLHDEMFGKDLPNNEQVSEDEDWGPHRRKRRGNESDAAGTLVALRGMGNESADDTPVENMEKQPSISKDKRTLFRIPPNAVEKLREVFAENELPSRDVRESLSNQLGIAFEKVNKWFKNARYAALKIRKAEGTTCVTEHSSMPTGKTQMSDPVASKDNSDSAPSPTASEGSKSSRRVHQRTGSLPKKSRRRRAADTSPTDMDKMSVWLSKAVNLKRKSASKKKASNPMSSKDKEQRYFVELERIFCLQEKLKKMKAVLQRVIGEKTHASDKPLMDRPCVVYVPVAAVREKV